MQTLGAPAAERLDRVLARADAYRLLAAAFCDPDGPLPGDLETDALIDAVEALGVTVAPSEREAVRAIDDRPARASEHRAIFGHTVAHGCPPYETEYGRRHIFGQAQELADIGGFYGAFGLRPANDGERLDHISCELEFLAIVALKEAYAVARGHDDAATISRDAAGAFLRDHPGRWLPALAGQIGRSAPHTGFAVLASLAARVADVHAAELGMVPDHLGPDDIRPIEDEPDGFVFTCGVDDADPAIPG